jgi:hypothetical protein
MDCIMEFSGALFMMANALYFQQLVRLQVKLVGSKPPRPQTITAMRVAAGVLAVVLGFIAVNDCQKIS